MQPRQNMFGLSGINSALSPITSLLNRMPSYLIPNPDALLPTRSFEPCDDDKGQSGTCMNSVTCSNNGGKASDSCGGMFGNTCCISTEILMPFFGTKATDCEFQTLCHAVGQESP